MRKILLPLAAALAGAVVWGSLALAQRPAEAAFPGQNGRIALEDYGQISTINPDGSDLRVLTKTPSSRYAPANYSPSYSADGTKIAFVSVRDGQQNPEIYTMNADGSEEVRRTVNARVAEYTDIDTDPVWSPDGTKIAFVSGRAANPGDLRDANLEIYVMDADGSNVTRLTFTDKTRVDESPAWSPDGTKIAFTRRIFVNDRFGASNLLVMDADGRNQRLLFNTPASEGAPDWSPDGTRIVFTRDEILNTVRSDGTGRTYLGVKGRQPVWSPDGREIGFLDRNSGKFRTVDADGSDPSGDLSRVWVYGGIGWQPAPETTAANQ